MRRLIFLTQKLDPDDPVLGATVPMVRALARRVDELVVLCDSAANGAVAANVRVNEFGAATQAGRGLRFEAALARELRPRPLAVVAHMVPLYALLAAPLVRPLGIPLVLWYTHWKAHGVLRAAVRVATSVVSVDRTSFPLASAKLRPIGHGIDVDELPCAGGSATDGPLRALVIGRYSPTKGLDETVRGFRLALERGLDGRLELRGPATPGVEQDEKGRLVALVDDDRIVVGGPVPRSEIPALLARADVLINNHRAADKVVYEAAAACVPVLASSEAFSGFLPDELRFDSSETLADRLLSLDRRRRPELREAVARSHSVDTWAEGILSAAEQS
jgi:glycosyltransferase involved in cell wall biosynthesis